MENGSDYKVLVGLLGRGFKVRCPENQVGTVAARFD